jgi:hypothetical protein
LWSTFRGLFEVDIICNVCIVLNLKFNGKERKLLFGWLNKKALFFPHINAVPLTYEDLHAMVEQIEGIKIC